MRNISDLPIEGTLHVHVRDGQLVAKGSHSDERARVVGHARVEQREGNTQIHVESSVVISLPAGTDMVVEGNVHEIVLKNLGTVTVDGSHGDLQASDLQTLRVEGAIHGSASLRRIEGETTLNDIMGEIGAKELGNVRLHEIYGSAAFRGVGDLTMQGGVMGSLSVKDGKAIRAHHVRGSLSMKRVGEVEIEQVEGDLSIKEAAAVSSRRVRGDVRLREISGAIVLERVEGDLVVRDPGSSLRARVVQGDAHLRGELTPGGEYSLRADGDVTLELEGNAHVSIRCDHEVEVGEGLEKEQGEDGLLHVYLGQREGAAHVTIEADGNVFLNAEEEEHEHEGHRHHRHHRHHHRHYRRHFGPKRWGWHSEGEEEIEVELHMKDVEREVEEAMEEVRSELRRAGETVRTELKRALRDVERGAGMPVGDVVRTTVRDLFQSLRPTPPAPPERPAAPPRPTAPPRPAAPPTEEVLTILQMVQAGTITPEEAEKLIRAME